VHLELLAAILNRLKFSRKSRVEFRWTVQTQTSPGKRVSPSPGKSTESESAISWPPHSFRFAWEVVILRNVKKTIDCRSPDFSEFMA
jgi:hypothetical protein